MVQVSALARACVCRHAGMLAGISVRSVPGVRARTWATWRWALDSSVCTHFCVLCRVHLVTQHSSSCISTRVLVGALQLVCRTVAVVCCAAAALSVPVCGPPCCSCLLRAPLRLPCALPQLALGSIVSVDGLQHVVACSKSVQPPQIDRAAVLCVC